MIVMSDTPTPAANTDKGRYYDFIKNATSDNFKTATLNRGLALAATPLKMQPWYTTVSASHHDKLKAANLKAWGSQNRVDQLFKQLDVYPFAKPLLQAKLKEHYGIEDDVSTTYLRLYLPKNLPWYAHDVTGGVTTRTVSLLDAALHNFATTETVDADSQFISKPDDRGHFDVIAIKHKMTIGQFQSLCRELDLGALYKKHLDSYLLSGEPVAEGFMQLKVTESQKDALAVAAQLAWITGDIQYDTCQLMLEFAKDEPQLLLNGRLMRCCDLSMMGTRLTGIVLLIPAVPGSGGIRRLIAYIPHDPDHPLKEYDSADTFMTELVRQLRENKVGTSSKQSYRQFFSQFVDQQQRGHFFADLDRRLVTVRWHDKEDPTDQRPTWREDAVARPRLEFEHLPLSGNYWAYAYRQKLNKILNDAREIAVSTADTDSKARWAWWDNFKKIVSDIFNVALLIATPFVPGLGELMMAYTAYQLTSDVIEGIVDLAEGLGSEAAEHVISVVTDVIQLAAFGAGAEIGNALKLKLSPLVDGMKPVKLPDGKKTLWQPDLAPYEQKNVTLSAGSKPDEYGLHRHANQNILPLDDKLYVVEKASKAPTSRTHRIKHPTRPNAYKPTLEHNGHGAWVHEAENPVDWESETLMRRLGHRVDRFSPTELEQIRVSSGTQTNALRRMHIDSAPPPAILADTIKRFIAYDEAKALDGRSGETSKRLYQAGETSDKAQILLLRQSFPNIPLTVAETVLADAKAAERTIMAGESRLPLRIKTLAREMNFEAGTARAYDGFYRNEQVVPDTERLALNTLKFYTDSFADLRIEVWDGIHDGTLRCSAGPEDASTVRRLIRDEHGQYEVLDGDNKKLHNTGDFYESILRALPEDKRAALGYQRGQGRLLKIWIMEKSAAPAERRTAMAEPPIRPVADIKTVNLVRGPALFRSPATPQERIKNLYPGFSEQEAHTFFESLRAKGDPDQAIDRLKDELTELRDMLAEWERKVLGYVSPESGPGIDYYNFRSHGGRHIRERLLECFERKSEAFGERNTHPENGYTLDLSSDLMGPNLDRWWRDLRKQPNIKKYLDQITVLNLDKARFSADAGGLLNDLRTVRHLSARFSDLKELPAGVGKMHLLETLRLTNNDIRLTPESARLLGDLTRLETLILDNNPLLHRVDVGRMRRLKILSLRTTGLDTWPERLFMDGIIAKHRPRGFYLDLRGSPIKTVPNVVRGSDHALIVARTRLDTWNLDDVDRVRFEDYRQSVGLSPEQTYERVASDEIAHWTSLPDDAGMYRSSTGVGTYRDESWNDVASEPDSADFFKVIRKQRQSQDYRDPEARKRLTRRVWEMIDAASLDTDLREELFKQASHPETCADAGSQLFNKMGMKVLVSKAHTESTSAVDLETRLVKLARSTARLDQVGEIARAEIHAQLEKSRNDAGYHPPDEVEVHLAFETGLAKRLDLPWQSEAMLYHRTARVDQKLIDTAYETIIEREKGDGLVNRMIDPFESPFWQQHLRNTHPAEFDANDHLFKGKQELVDDLYLAQQDWVNTTDPKDMTSRQRILERLARQLDVPQAEAFTEDKDEIARLYERLMSDLGYERNELARKLTREAMARAGL
jgi:hypothetical protein